MSFFSKIGNAISSAANAVGSAASSAANAVGSAATTAAKAVGHAAESTFEAAKSGAQAVGNAVRDTASKVATATPRLLDSAKQTLGTVGEKAKAGLASTGRFIKNTATGAKDLVSKVTNSRAFNTLKGIGTLGGTLYNIGSLPFRVKDAATDLARFIGQPTADLGRKAIDSAAALVKNGGSLIKGVVDSIEVLRAAKNAGGAVARVLPKIGQSFGKGLSRFVPGANIAIAGADAAHFGVVMSKHDSSLGKRITSGLTAGLSVVGATNIPIVSQAASFLSLVPSTTEAFFFKK